MERARVVLLSLLVFLVWSAAVLADKDRNGFGTAVTTTRADSVDLAVEIAPAHQDPGADPFDVEILCVAPAGMPKWLLRLAEDGRGALNLMGVWHSASYYDVDVKMSAGVAFSVVLPAPLVDPGDQLLVSIDSDEISSLGQLFAVAVDAPFGLPLRQDVLRTILVVDVAGNLVVTATNLTHVPLLVPLASLVLALAPTPDWIPETAPGIRWSPDPPLSPGFLALGPDQTVTTVLPMPSVPGPSAAAYRASLALYAGMVDAYPGDYLAVGFSVAWGASWGYLPVVVP